MQMADIIASVVESIVAPEAEDSMPEYSRPDLALGQRQASSEQGLTAGQTTTASSFTPGPASPIGSPDDAVKTKGRSSPYDHFKRKGISITTYLQRWQQYAHAENAMLIIALVYFDRICTKTKLLVTGQNVHNVLLACLVVAAKWCSDKPHSNKYYSAVGGVTAADLKVLEVNAIKDMKFKLHVSAKEFSRYEKEFDAHLTPAQTGLTEAEYEN